MKNERTLSVIIPAYNEEKNIEAAVKTAIDAIENKFIDYEIIIFDDCSRDKTGQIADKLAESNSKIKVIHNAENKGYAYNYKKGVELATKNYIGLVPGDDETESRTVREIFEAVGKADMIIPYTANQYIRPLPRRIISYSFTFIINFLFFGRRKLRYFNGPVVHKKELIKSVKITADNFAFQAEALVKLIKQGHTFYQVPMYIKPRTYGKSSAMKIKNLSGVAKTILVLFKEIYFKKNERINT